jgi:hypothetical protein
MGGWIKHLLGNNCSRMNSHGFDLAQEAYCGEWNGAGCDFELGPGPEHIVEIITLRSAARME